MYGMIRINEEDYRRLCNVADEIIRAFAVARETGGTLDMETMEAIHDLAEVALGADMADKIRAEVAADFGGGA